MQPTIDIRSHHGAVVTSHRLGGFQAYWGKGWTRFAVRRISSISILDCFQVIGADIHRVVYSPKSLQKHKIHNYLPLWAPGGYCIYIHIMLHNIHNLPTIFHLCQPPWETNPSSNAFCFLNRIIPLQVLQQHSFFYVGLCRKDFKSFQRFFGFKSCGRPPG